MNNRKFVFYKKAVVIATALGVLLLSSLTGAASGVVRLSPAAPGGTFHAGGWIDAAPNGVPDFDQKQEAWLDSNTNWSWDGPLAAANALWYLDSLFESFPVALPLVSDHFPLVQSYQPGVLDDHDPANLTDLVQDLAARMDTDGQTSGFPHAGTDPLDAKAALDNYLQDKGLSTIFQVSLEPAPPYTLVSSAVTTGTLVLLLLGFWQNQSAEVRLGGHWMTVAGVDTGNNLVYFADPFIDNAEAGGTGLVYGHTGSSHPADTHNDPAKVSYDSYVQSSRSGVAGLWGPNNYLSLSSAGNFSADMNNTADLAPYFDLPDPLAGLVVKAEYGIFIKPDYRCVGDLDGNLVVDRADIVLLALSWHQSQPSCLDDDKNGRITINEIQLRLSRLGQKFLKVVP
ncbi:MAG: hypothetical protein HY326_02760 [Chloroflexi bacterium]|nr:hypothetical protein [Chloroflexota bacterium]